MKISSAMLFSVDNILPIGSVMILEVEFLSSRIEVLNYSRSVNYFVKNSMYYLLSRV